MVKAHIPPPSPAVILSGGVAVVEPAGRERAKRVMRNLGRQNRTYTPIMGSLRLACAEPPKLITFASGNPSPLAQDDICWVKAHVPSPTIHCGRSKPLPYGVWDSIVVSIEGTRDLKHLSHIMGTLGKVLCLLSFKKVGAFLQK